MTADSSENETQSRPNEAYLSEVRRAYDRDDIPYARDARDGLKGSRRREGNDADRAREREESVRRDVLELGSSGGNKGSNSGGNEGSYSGVNEGSNTGSRGEGGSDTGNESGGTGDVKTGSNEGHERTPGSGVHPRDGSDQSRRELKRQKLSRDNGPRDVDLSDDDRDEETEDDFEEGDAPAADEASGGQQQRHEQDACQKQQQMQNNHHHQQQSHHQHQHPQQQQLQAALQQLAGGWESFLPQKHLRVLLAEDDDSTRHVVAALLRNCGYEVTSAANGMQAWEMLEDQRNHYDLVLTDVVMPCLSGVGLVTKMMSHDATKRIPVVMMSSHDSLDIVYRCLSKGASDFLVKPVRKNELKNLWQHVWRRCHSSSGSGSGSGNGKSMQPRSRVGSGNNSPSNDGSENGSSGLNVRGGSDNGSGTHSVMHVLQNREKLTRNEEDVEEGQATSLQRLSDQDMGQDLEMAIRRAEGAELKNRHEEEGKPEVDMQQDNPSTSADDNRMEDEAYNSSGGGNSGGSSAKVIDLIGGIACHVSGEVDDGSGDGIQGTDRVGSSSPALNDKSGTNSEVLPHLELSLKRPQAAGEDDPDAGERCKLRQSGGSAFSRYSTGALTQSHPSGSPISLTGFPMSSGYGGGTSSPRGSILGAGKAGQLQLSTPVDRVGSSKGSGEGSTSLQLHPHVSHHRNGQDNSSSGAGPSGQDGFGGSRSVKDETASLPQSCTPGRFPLPSSGMMSYDGLSSGFGPGIHSHPVFYPHSAAPPWASGPSHLGTDRGGEYFDNPPYHEHGQHHSHHRGQPQMQHHHHHQSHLGQAPGSRPLQDEQTVTNAGTGAPLCGLSNMGGTNADGNNGQSGSSNGYGNGSINGSASGSNNMGNVQCSMGAPGGPNGDTGNNNGQFGNATSNGITGANGGMACPEQNRHARREAALNKFRQKRKERCFEKKVRYQSRKRLAEQRPRVRGQFVRQAVYESNPTGFEG